MGFLVLAVLAVIVLIVSLVFLLINSVGVKATKMATTVIEEKQIVPTHITFVMSGKTMIPINHPTSYRIKFRIDGKEVTPTVNKNFFDEIKDGDAVEVDYGFGRLNGSIEPTSIRSVHEK